MMIYNGREIPKLGFGLMRLPMLGNEVDIEQVKDMVDLFMEKGFTYFDTAYGYLDGKSEEAAKVALVDRYPRESFILATKCPAWLANDAEGAYNMFKTSLKRTGAGYFDFYLLHNLGNERSAAFDDYNIWKLFAEEKKKGTIKKLGFSMHDSAQHLDEVLEAHPEMDFVQLQINYADWESISVESRKCYEVARKHNKPIVVMEPVKGGNLASLPSGLNEILRTAEPEKSIASWALRYALSLEGIVTVLSGMSNMEQMKDNLETLNNFKPLDDKELAVIAKVQEELGKIPNVPCTGCNYCVKGCPSNIIISDIFNGMNTYLVHNNLKGGKWMYSWSQRHGTKGSDCIECGQCEKACPQHIKIIDELKRAVEVLEK